VALRTTYIKNVEFKIIKIRTGCRLLHNSENLNVVAQNLQLGHGLGIAGLKESSQRKVFFCMWLETMVVVDSFGIVQYVVPNQQLLVSLTMHN